MTAQAPDRGSSLPTTGPGPALVRAAGLFLLLGTAASAVLLALALFRFRGAHSHEALAWYLVAVTGIVITRLAARLPEETRVGVSLSALFAVLILFGVELALERMERAQFVRVETAVARRLGVQFDRRSMPEVVRDLRKDGVPAVPSVVPKVLLPSADAQSSPETEFRAPFLPLAGVSRRPTVQLCIEGGRYPIYQSDEFGFLNPPGSWAGGPGLVALIGDSYTHGYCVADDSTIAADLRPKWHQVLSLGTGGSGSLAELGTLTEYAAPLAPGLVLWMYSENDLRDLARERQNPTLMHYLDAGYCQGLRLEQPLIDSTLVAWIDRQYGVGSAPRAFGEFGWRQTLVLAALRDRLPTRKDPEHDADPMIQLALFEQALAEAQSRVAGWGGRLVFVFLPAWERIFKTAALDQDQVRPAVLAAVQRLGMPLVDLAPVFEAQPDKPALFARGELGTAHYSAAGYALVAESLVEALTGAKDSLATLHRPTAVAQTSNACQPTPR